MSQMQKILIQIFIAVSVSGLAKSAAIKSSSYATDLCNIHNRFSSRVACPQIESALQSAGVSRSTIDQLIRHLRQGDRHAALEVVDRLGLDLKSGEAQGRAAVDYARGVLVGIDSPSRSIASLERACELVSDKRYCFQ